MIFEHEFIEGSFNFFGPIMTHHFDQGFGSTGTKLLTAGTLSSTDPRCKKTTPITSHTTGTQSSGGKTRSCIKQWTGTDTPSKTCSTINSVNTTIQSIALTTWMNIKNFDVLQFQHAAPRGTPKHPTNHGWHGIYGRTIGD